MDWTGRNGLGRLADGQERQGAARRAGGWLVGGLPWFFSAFPLGCRLQVALQIKKERPQGTGKSEANKRPVDRKVAWSWLPYLVYLAHLCPPRTHWQRQTLSLPTDPHRLRLSLSLRLRLPLSECTPVCISLPFLSSDEMAQSTQLDVS